jgi:hypothetical protein
MDLAPTETRLRRSLIQLAQGGNGFLVLVAGFEDEDEWQGPITRSAMPTMWPPVAI